MAQSSIHPNRSMPDLQAHDLAPLNLKSLERVSPDSISVGMKSPLTPISKEAPGRLQLTPNVVYGYRCRSMTLPDNLGDPFCRLDGSRADKRENDLCHLVECVDDGLKCGIRPILADGALGGTYFLRDKERTIRLVFKPADEEPNAPNNPHSHSTHVRGSYKGGVLPGFGVYREVCAYLLDRGFAGVPPTHLAKVKHPHFSDVKLGSVQSYVRGSEGSADDVGPVLFGISDVQRIAFLDIRLCNLDRHGGNLLACPVHPYSSSASDASLRLVPIDHGYILPHILHISEANFAWLHWPQVAQPIGADILSEIASLDAQADIALLKRVVGEAISEPCLLTLRTTTMLLQKGAAAGCTFFDLGKSMIACADEKYSPLQRVIFAAIHRVQSRASIIDWGLPVVERYSKRHRSATTDETAVDDAALDGLLEDGRLPQLIAELEKALEEFVASLVSA